MLLIKQKIKFKDEKARIHFGQKQKDNFGYYFTNLCNLKLKSVSINNSTEDKDKVTCLYCKRILAKQND